MTRKPGPTPDDEGSMSCSSCTSVASSMVAVRQAQTGSDAAMKAAAIALRTQKDQGAQVVTQLLEAAKVQQQAMVDSMGRLDAIG